MFACTVDDFTVRPTIDAYYMDMAHLAATRGTCRRRRVGCVLADRHGRVLSIGYNGVARGLPHCLNTPCDGAELPSGVGLDRCEAIHAEQSALVACRALDDAVTAYVTTAPCVSCTKLFLNTDIARIVYATSYPEAGAARRLWVSTGRRWDNVYAPNVLQS